MMRGTGRTSSNRLNHSESGTGETSAREAVDVLRVT